MDNRLKRQLLEDALRRGTAEVWTSTGVVLRLNWKAGLPLEINDGYVAGTRYQFGHPTPYKYPWDAVLKIVDPDGKEHIFRRPK